MKLRLKPTVIPFTLPEQVVLQFCGQYAKIPDPDGSVLAMTRALDGTRTRAEVIEHVLTRFPEKNPDELRATLDDYIKHKLVEIPEEELPTKLSPQLQLRLSRNMDFFGSLAEFGANKFEYQERLQECNICVLGCGGIGTHILFESAALGVKNLTLVDFDRIELSNLNRQILYRECDIGALKVETAKKRLLEFNSQLEIRTHSARLDSADTVASIVAGHDLVICVADRPANYVGDWVNQGCVRARVPFIVGGVDVRRSLVFSVHPGVSGCEECWIAAARAKNELVNNISTMKKQQDITFERPAPAFVPMVAVAAGIILCEAVKYLTQCQPPLLTNKLMEFCFDDYSLNVAETWQRNPQCRVCADC